MINNDIPVVFSYSVLSDEAELQLYRLNNHVYIDDEVPKVESHYMVATGVIEYSDDVKELIGSKCMLRIAAYGKEYYMDFDEYSK